MESPHLRRTARLLGASGSLAVLLAAAAGFAIMVVLFSGEPIHRLWGAWACAGYATAGLIVVAWKGPRGKVAAAGVSLAGATAGPLAQLAAAGRNMPEVSVIEQAAALLVQHGSPYALTAQQGGPGFLRYDPYLPAMTIFGLPHALADGADYYDDTDQASGAGYGGDAGDPADAPVPQRARAGGRATVTLTS